MSTASAAQARFMVTALQLPLHCFSAAAAPQLCRIIESLAKSAAFADRECARRSTRRRRPEAKNKTRAKTKIARRCAALRSNNQNPSPEATRGEFKPKGSFHLVNGTDEARSRQGTPVRGRANSIPAARPPALRACRCRERAFALDRDFGHRLGMLGDHMARADVAVERINSGRSAATTAPDCRACPRRRGPRSARPGPAQRPRSAGRSACASISGMSPRQTTAPSASSGTAAMPALQRACASPSAKSGLCTKRTLRPCERRLDLVAPDGR